MIATPNTMGVVLLFAAVFVACILWATHGSATAHDASEEDLHGTSKPS